MKECSPPFCVKWEVRIYSWSSCITVDPPSIGCHCNFPFTEKIIENNLMQHEMQHKNKKPLKNQGFKHSERGIRTP